MSKSSETQGKLDGWQCILTNLGNPDKDYRQSTTYSRRAEPNIGQLEALYSQDALFARIVDTIPEHATRRWIRIDGALDSDQQADKDFGSLVQDALSDLDAQNKFFELMQLDRLYGGAAMVIGADDGLSMEEPLDFDRIKSIKHLNVLSRYEIFPGPRDLDPNSTNFRNPQWFSFTPMSGQVSIDALTRIHHSRVICLKGIRVNTRGRESDEFWGEPILNRVFDSIRRFGTVYDYSEALFKDLVQGVMQIDGLNQLICSDTGNETLLKRMQLINMSASAFNMILLDSGENYERRTTSFAGISELIVRVMDEVSAAAEIPLSRLFGQAPTGLSTDDNAGKTTFYDSIANKQRRLLRKPIKRVIEAVLASKEGPTAGVVPENWSFDFLSLNEPTDDQVAQQRKVEAETDAILINNGQITAQEARTRLFNDASSPYVLLEELLPEDEPEESEPIPEDEPEESEPIPEDAFNPSPVAP